MSAFCDELKSVITEVQSDSGSVTMRQVGLGPTTASINVHKLSGRDEARLAEDIEYSFASCREEHVRQMRLIAERHGRLGEEPPQHHLIANLLPGVLGDNDELVGRGSSSLGYVEIDAYARGELLVTFRRNAVRRTDIWKAVLESEVNEAIAKAMQALVGQIRRLLSDQIVANYPERTP